MKNKIILLASFLILLFGESKSQSVTFDNQFNCDVTIDYEMRDVNGAPCGVCSSGTLLLNAGQSITLTQCAGYVDMCINIIDVGGCTPPSPAHLHDGACHTPTVSITGGAAACCNGATWIATWNISTSTFLIQ